MNKEAENLIRMEDGFEEYMKSTVEPFLDSLRKEDYFEGEGGIRIHYSEFLPANPKGTVMVSHGFSECEPTYLEIVAFFVFSGYRVLFPEHRGHGRSDRLAEDPDRVYVDSFVNYIKDMKTLYALKIGEGTEKKILYGHSMGGAVAAYYAETYPEDFDRVILSSPMIRINTGKVPAFLAKSIARMETKNGAGEEYVIGMGPFEPVFNLETASYNDFHRYHYVFRKRCEIPFARTWGATYGWLDASFRAEKTIRRNADKIKAPVLLMYAGNDTLVDPAATKEFAEGLADAEVLYFEDSRHALSGSLPKNRTLFYEKIAGVLG